MVWRIIALYVAASVISIVSVLLNLDILNKIVLSPDVPKIGKVMGVWLITVVIALSVLAGEAACRLIGYFYGG